jgi:peptide deformylase
MAYYNARLEQAQADNFPSGSERPAVAAKVLPIRYWDDPVLSQVCAKVEDNEFGPALAEFGRELAATMGDKSGIGLAASQVGVLRRMFCMSFPGEERLPLLVCNPELVLTGATVPGQEGCLSVPGVFEQVYRAESVSMRYREPLLGKTCEVSLSALAARIAQHEADHLDGIMFFDYRDKRESYVTGQYPAPRGARMSRQLSKRVLREWEKQKRARGLG